jgi:hypothetical protein
MLADTTKKSTARITPSAQTAFARINKWTVTSVQ